MRVKGRTTVLVIDAILIDDNPWVRDLWEDRGRQFGKIIRTFATYMDFVPVAAHMDRRTPIFVDLRFGGENDWTGRKIIRRLKGLGFNSLFLATAFRLDESPEQIGVRGVVGKEPPTWLVADSEATDEPVEAAPLSANERAGLLAAMSVAERERFKARMGLLLEALYGSGSPMDGFGTPPPEAVAAAWEDGIYRSLSDEALKATIDAAWKRSLQG
jgi:hypothetical protein